MTMDPLYFVLFVLSVCLGVQGIQTDVKVVHKNLCLLPPEERFTCSNGVCVYRNQTCNGLWDCQDGGDEARELCGSRSSVHTISCDLTDQSVFVCREGDCIHKNRTCDGVVDCLYGEDEAPAQCGCQANEFQCSNISCVDIMKRCNREADCENGADELDCDTYQCPKYHFKCDNHYCIPQYLHCNFEDDCGDNSDENTCHARACYYGEFRCNNSQCVPEAMLCDGAADCKDGSDETNCDQHFRCSQNGIYITADKVCDKSVDCPGHEDETKCGACGSRDMQCPNGLCISQGNKCDGICDCADTCDDEADCTNEPFLCPAGDYYLCRNRRGDPSNRRCIAKEYVCDGINNCFTGMRGTDEYFCPVPNQVSCPPDRFDCDDGTGRCILTKLLCDHQNDCTNGRDERDCDFEQCSTEEFKCTNHECLPMSKRCDGTPDCLDRSDEIGCGSHQCDPGTKKCRNGQCILESKWCDYHRDCYDNSDEEGCSHRECTQEEFRCKSGQCIPKSGRCFKDREARTGCADMSHLFDCRNVDCTQDRPDLYKCRNSYCIFRTRLCDNVPDCELIRDDEDRPECVYVCPEGDEEICTCQDTSMDCSGQNMTEIPKDTWKEIGHSDFNFSHNFLGTTLSDNVFAGKVNISNLDLTDNEIEKLDVDFFKDLWKLQSLYLSHNRITKIEKGCFTGLANVKTVHLDGNHLASLSTEAFTGLTALTILDLSGQNLTIIQKMTFRGLLHLRTLNLSRNQIVYIDGGAFFGLKKLKVLDLSRNSIRGMSDRAFSGLTSLQTLYLTNNQIGTLDANVFKVLPSLETVHMDEFRFCCLPRRQDSECYPGPDEFSSCEDLMANYILRVSLWVIGIIAFVGNVIVIIWRLQKGRESKSIQVHSFLITNLALGDLLMGIYLLIIAGVDMKYRGVYIIHDERWRHSTLCQIAGFLSTFSSELSVFTLVLITIDRLICIIFPFKIKNLGIKEARVVMFFMWLSVAIMAAIPLADIDYFRNFYGRSGVCLALHITPDKPSGWEYSVFVFIALNLISFVVIFVSYYWMFIVARRTQNAVRTPEMKRDIKKERAMAKRMTLIVMTDFCCWVPICLLGVASLMGARIPQQVYAWMAVFFLPINAGINPVLYTLSTAPFIKHAWMKAGELSISFKSERLTSTKASFVDDSSTHVGGLGTGIKMRNLSEPRYQAVDTRSKTSKQNGRTPPRSHRYLESSLSIENHTEMEPMDMCVILPDENSPLQNAEVVYKRGERS